MVPNVTVTSASDRCALDDAGVGVDAARQVSGDDECSGAGRFRYQSCQRRGGLAQPAVAADAKDAVDDQVGCRDRLGGRLLRRVRGPASRRAATRPSRPRAGLTRSRSP